ncbi:MAG: NAD(P)H-dependent oxidoreductase [Woeseiaceae bacterium]
MRNIRVALIFGSGRERDPCDAVAMWTAEQIWSQGSFSLDVIDPATLPLRTLHRHDDRTEVMELRGRLGNADAFVFVMPERDHGYPDAVNFVIDAANVEWQAKPVGIVSYGGSSGGLRSVEQLRQTFAEHHAVTVLNSVNFGNVHRQFDVSGNLRQPYWPSVAMAAMLEKLHWWAVALRTARKKRPYGLVRDRRSPYASLAFRLRQPPLAQSTASGAAVESDQARSTS